MKRPAIVAAGLVLVTICGLGQTGPGTGDEIARILALQKSAWNNGDIEGFMAYYMKSDGITFQSGNSRISGWETVLTRYRTNYAPGNMGRLDFTDLAVNILSDDAAYVLGRFKLDIGGEHREGVFTLILRKTGEGWRIVHDHTSSE